MAAGHKRCTGWADTWHVLALPQLPLYVPNEAEKADPKLYAHNVRELMLKEGGFFSSEASLLDSRAYIALLRGKTPPPKSRAGQALAAKSGASVK